MKPTTHIEYPAESDELSLAEGGRVERRHTWITLGGGQNSGQDFEIYAEVLEHGIVVEAKADLQVGANARHRHLVVLRARAEVVRHLSGHGVFGTENVAYRSVDGLALQGIQFPVLERKRCPGHPIKGNAHVK